MKRKIAIFITTIIGIFFIAVAVEKNTVDSLWGKIYGEKITELGNGRPDKQTFTIMTFNAELLWDGVLPEEGMLEFSWKGNREKAEEHMKEIADVIRQHNPDIVNLVEVENLNALNTLNEKFLKDLGYHAYLVNGRDTYTGEDVALLTRIKPEGGKIYRDDRAGISNGVKKSVSKNYYAYFNVSGIKFVLIAIHFLAEPLNKSRLDQRQAQADAMRSLAIEKQDQGYRVIIAGDFNDFDGDPKCLDRVNSAPITNVLSSIRAMDKSISSDDLVNAACLIPVAERYTAFYDSNSNGKVDAPKELTSIDHILLSPMLAKRVEKADILHTYDPREVSDHFPVVIRLNMKQE